MPEYIVRASRNGHMPKEDVFDSSSMEAALEHAKHAWADLGAVSWLVLHAGDYPHVVARIKNPTASPAPDLAIGYARWKDPIVGRMVAENAADLSDAEIDRTLSPCVCGPRLVEVAKAMREAGTITLQSLEEMRRR